MKEYLGNYLGLCINNDDPEKRGRVQVFIPHIMPALFENWNEVGEDIKLLCVGDNLPESLPGPVIEKLKKILPWAESALPVMGASAAGSLISSPSYSQEAGENFYDQSPVPDPAGGAAGAAGVGGATAGAFGTSGTIAYTGNTGQSTGPHLDVRWKDKRPITAADADRYLLVNGRPPSSFGVTSSYGPRNLYGRTFHYGIDFGTPSGSPITLTGGASFGTNRGNTGSGGVVAEINTPQGVMQLLHLNSVTGP